MLQTLGVVDLAVTEALWRLTKANDTVIDAGANIGYMTGVLAAALQRGQIYSFEPHPKIFADLQDNVRSFRRSFPTVTFHLRGVALSDHSGTVTMSTPSDFAVNQGRAQVTNGGDIIVDSVTLDDTFEQEMVSVLKLDVENHELAVLEGAQRMFRQRRIRHCVFEEHRPAPTEVTRWFERQGYAVFRLGRRLRGPFLTPATEQASSVHWLPPSFLATCAPDEARAAYRPAGWQSLLG